MKGGNTENGKTINSYHHFKTEINRQNTEEAVNQSKIILIIDRLKGTCTVQ